MNPLSRLLRRWKNQRLSRDILAKVLDIPAAANIPDFERRTRENIQRCLEVREWLGLDHGPALEVMDIGTGYGFLPYLCRAAGHRVHLTNYAAPEKYGLNPDHASHQEASEVFGQALERLSLRALPLGIHAQTPLPELGFRVDVVVAMGTMFNADWRMEDYAFWLRDLARALLKPGQAGRVALISNNYNGVAHPGRGWLAFMEGREALRAQPFVSSLEVQGLRALIHLHPGKSA